MEDLIYFLTKQTFEVTANHTIKDYGPTICYEPNLKVDRGPTTIQIRSVK